MAIVNRTNDPSEQRVDVAVVTGVAATGATVPAYLVPFPCSVQAIRLGAAGLSGTPTGRVVIQRAVAAGVTTITDLQALQTMFNVHTSMPLSMSFSSNASLFLLANDLLLVQTGGANSSSEKIVGSIVLQKLQDIVTFFGV